MATTPTLRQKNQVYKDRAAKGVVAAKAAEKSKVAHKPNFSYFAVGVICFALFGGNQAFFATKLSLSTFAAPTAQQHRKRKEKTKAAKPPRPAASKHTDEGVTRQIRPAASPDTHHQRPRAPKAKGRPRHPHPQRLPLQREGEEMLNGISQTVPDPAPIPITLVRVAVAIGSEVLVTASKSTPSKREHKSDSSTVFNANTQSNRKQRIKSRQRLLC
ncbi:MAG: hypothetical protein EXX96DRAFT_543355 [Benjaminiella poitrasii]|nr:MAG: hypothetical protein EXX96DRAFT_543355 [Benjaminiella poitrasii]